MNGLTLDELRERHAFMAAERMKAATKARETDLGFACVLGELETLIKLIEAKEEKKDGREP